ncbi:MAG: histidine phosphatase family protein [Mycobacteriales bacterium]
MITYLLRHAPTEYSTSFRVNGELTIDVPLSADGETRCAEARTLLPIGIITCVTSNFARCQRTATLLLGGSTVVSCDARLGELDYGHFEGKEFLAYARWLIAHGPWVRPPGAHESQAEALTRMLTSLNAALDLPGPRLVVAHGLLVSLIQWARLHPGDPWTAVLLPGGPLSEPLCSAGQRAAQVDQQTPKGS